MLRFRLTAVQHNTHTLRSDNEIGFKKLKNIVLNSAHKAPQQSHPGMCRATRSCAHKANGQVAPAEQLWGPIRRDGCLRVLARTGRADCRRSCASFPPFSGSIAMSTLCVVRWRTRARQDRVVVHPRALEPGSRHHTWHGGLLPPGYSWQQS